jgi:hypothetical protein
VIVYTIIGVVINNRIPINTKRWWAVIGILYAAYLVLSFLGGSLIGGQWFWDGTGIYLMSVVWLAPLLWLGEMEIVHWYWSNQRKKYLELIICAIVTTITVGCKQPQQVLDTDFDGIFAHQKPVDMTPVLDVYNWATGAEDSIDFAEFIVKLIPECKRYLNNSIYAEELESNWFINMTDTITLSCGYMDCLSDNVGIEEFMISAEELYNASMVLRNMGSLYEVWLRNELLLKDARRWDSDIIMDVIRNLNVAVLEEYPFRVTLKECRDSVLKYMDMDMGIDAWDDNPYPVLFMQDMDEYLDIQFERFFSYWSTDDAEMDSTAVEVRDSIMAGDRLRRYKDANDDDQLGVILQELAGCKDFDEQCALWRLWTNSKESIYEDEWIIAVGTLLMDSGKYNPYMNWIWMIWRSLFQSEFCGMSKDSIIPNDFYNEYRKKCYKAYINHFLSHPEDLTSAKWAKILVEFPNLNRMFGWAGNNALYEKVATMPARYEDAFE